MRDRSNKSLRTSSADREGRYGHQLCDRALVAQAGNNTWEEASKQVSVTFNEKGRLNLILAY